MSFIYAAQYRVLYAVYLFTIISMQAGTPSGVSSFLERNSKIVETHLSNPGLKDDLGAQHDVFDWNREKGNSEDPADSLIIQNVDGGYYLGLSSGSSLAPPAIQANFVAAINAAALNYPDADALIYNACTMPRDVENIPLFPRLKQLTFMGCKISSEVLFSLCVKMPGLQELKIVSPDFYMFFVPDWTLPHCLNACNDFNSLSIEFTRSSRQFDKRPLFQAAGIDVGLSLVHLKKLCLRGFDSLTSQELGMIIHKWPLLQELILNNCNIISLPINFKNLHLLQKLDLSNNSHLNAKTLVYIPKELRILDLSYTNSDSLDPNNWAHLRSLTHVKVHNSYYKNRYPLNKFMQFPEIKYISVSANEQHKPISRQELAVYCKLITTLQNRY